MKFYEKEVLSLPAGRTSDLIQKYKVYSCKAENDRYETPLFMAFRESGGAMSTLYKLEDKIQLDPKVPGAIEKLENSGADPGNIERVKGYINDLFSREPDPFPNGDHLFFILLKDDTIDLPNKPKPAIAFEGAAYYTLKELLEETELKPRAVQG